LVADSLESNPVNFNFAIVLYLNKYFPVYDNCKAFNVIVGLLVLLNGATRLPVFIGLYYIPKYLPVKAYSNIELISQVISSPGITFTLKLGRVPFFIVQFWSSYQLKVIVWTLVSL